MIEYSVNETLLFNYCGLHVMTPFPVPCHNYRGTCGNPQQVALIGVQKYCYCGLSSNAASGGGTLYYTSLASSIVQALTPHQLCFTLQKGIL